MATTRSISFARPSAETSEPETVAWRRPTKTRRPRSRLSSRSTSSSAPSRTVTDCDWRSANTASAASAPAARALATTSCSTFSSMPAHMADGPAGDKLGDDVWRQLVFQFGDLVAQGELLLLQPGDLQLVGHRQRLQRAHRVVEVLVLLAQGRDLGADARLLTRVQGFLVHPSERPAADKPAALSDSR